MPDEPPGLRRRAFLQAAVAGIAGRTLGATVAAADEETVEHLPLWPGDAPGGPAPTLVEHVSDPGALTGITRPRLEVYHPTRPGPLAVIVMSGGGYVRLEREHESRPVCQWLAQRGVTAFDLIYRLPGDGWPISAPFLDAVRAVRLVRLGAAQGGFKHVGVLGFSAGGHLAGMTAVRPDLVPAPAVDAADQQTARPDFAALIYPVIDLRPPLPPTRSSRILLGRDADPDEVIRLSVDAQVTRSAPPTFVAQSFDDPVSSIDNGLRMASALRAADVSVELHAFATGGHGWGLGRPDSAPAAWPDLFWSWLGETALRGPATP